MVEDLGDVEVVITARDLGRNLPAMWQETLQNGRTWDWAGYVADARTPGDPVVPGGAGRRFWRQQDIARIAARWAEAVGPQRVTMVTVPPPGADPDLLWNRFCEAAGIDPAWAPPRPQQNQALGAASALLLMRVNAVLEAGGLSWADYDRLIKHGLAKEGLASRRSREPAIGFDPPPWLRRRARRVRGRLDELVASGLRVVGDLADLEPVGVPGTPPGEVGTEEQLDAAVEAIAYLVRRLAGERARRGEGSAGGGTLDA